MMNSGVHGCRYKVHLQSFTLYVVVALSLLWALGAEWAGGPSPPTAEASSELQEPLVPLPLTLTVDPALAALGERNVVLTAPSFHDGRARTLEDAVETMARVQLGRTLTSAEISLIVQFLHTLTEDFQGRSLADHAEEAR
jgi:hypothetical protein